MKKFYLVLQLALVAVLLSVFVSVSAQYSTLYEVDFTTELPAYDSEIANGQAANIGSLTKLDDVSSDWVAVNQALQGLNNWYLAEGGNGMHPGNWRGASLANKPIETWRDNYSVRFTIELYVNELLVNNGVADLSTLNQMVFGITKRVVNGGAAAGSDAPSQTKATTLGILVDHNNTVSDRLVFKLLNDLTVFSPVNDLEVSDMLKVVTTVTKLETNGMFDIVADIYKKEGGAYPEVPVASISKEVTHQGIYDQAGDLLAFTAYSKLNKVDDNNDGELNACDTERAKTLWSYLKLEKEDIPNSNHGNPESLKKEISVYPSPVINNLFIRNVENGVVVNVFSVTGALERASMAVSNTVEIDMSSLPSGIYIVKAGAQTKRILKK